jgi:hypothetical protein
VLTVVFVFDGVLDVVLDELLLPHAAMIPPQSSETAKITQLLGLRIASPVPVVL